MILKDSNFILVSFSLCRISDNECTKTLNGSLGMVNNGSVYAQEVCDNRLQMSRGCFATLTLSLNSVEGKSVLLRLLMWINRTV